MIRVAVHGASGRMGTRLCALADRDERFRLVARFDRSRCPIGASAEAGSIDAIADFSADSGTRRAVELAGGCGAALLVGTTALSPRTLDELAELARSSPVMVAANTSRGIAVLRHLAGEAVRLLGEAYQVDLQEQHHRFKRDAPSGTAVRILQRIEEISGLKVPAERVHCIRAGDIVGEHQLQFTGPGERLTMAHAVADRDVFALGALDALAWLAGRPPGRYTIEQSFGL